MERSRVPGWEREGERDGRVVAAGSSQGGVGRGLVGLLLLGARCSGPCIWRACSWECLVGLKLFIAEEWRVVLVTDGILGSPMSHGSPCSESEAWECLGSLNDGSRKWSLVTVCPTPAVGGVEGVRLHTA